MVVWGANQKFAATFPHADGQHDNRLIQSEPWVNGRQPEKTVLPPFRVCAPWLRNIKAHPYSAREALHHNVVYSLTPQV